jgi:hypothetical protein
MQYMLLIYSNEASYGQMTQEQATTMTGAFMAYTEALVAAGVMVKGDRLQDTANATTVRAPDGAVQIHDGPFAETKEQLGGYYLIETPDLDVALAWAKKCPGTQVGSVEVRPIFAMPQG